MYCKKPEMREGHEVHQIWKKPSMWPRLDGKDKEKQSATIREDVIYKLIVKLFIIPLIPNNY